MRPTARTLKKLRDDGFVAGVVERWIPIKNHPAGGIRKDLFDCIDVLAVDRSSGDLLAVQACSATDHAKRLAKAKASDELKALLRNDKASFEVWSWRKGGPRGKRKTWNVKRTKLDE